MVFKQHQVTADSKYLDLCLHLLISSPLLFKLSLSSELLRIVDFSSRQSLQDLVDGLQDGACPCYAQVIWQLMPLSLRFQICFDNVVLVWYFLLLKERMWFLNLSLKVVEACPMYFAVELLVCTVASYTMSFLRQFPPIGHPF